METLHHLPPSTRSSAAKSCNLAKPSHSISSGSLLNPPAAPAGTYTTFAEHPRMPRRAQRLRHATDKRIIPCPGPLSSVPEPGMTSLMFLGLLAAAVAVRRRSSSGQRTSQQRKRSLRRSCRLIFSSSSRRPERLTSPPRSRLASARQLIDRHPSGDQPPGRRSGRRDPRGRCGSAPAGPPTPRRGCAARGSAGPGSRSLPS